MLRKIKHICLIAGLVSSLCLPASAESRKEPAELVDDFHAALIEAMKTPSWKGKIAILAPAVNASFEVETISRISLGRRSWQRLTPEQQSELQMLMTELIITSWAARFDGYKGQVFKVTATENMRRNRKRVKSLLETRSRTVTLDYQMEDAGEAWRIYDIVANGVSDLSLKRSNYSALFKDGGFAAVTAEIVRNINANQPE